MAGPTGVWSVDALIGIPGLDKPLRCEWTVLAEAREDAFEEAIELIGERCSQAFGHDASFTLERLLIRPGGGA